MKDEWILDVLSDLRNFARGKGLVQLAEQLDDTALLAACELASMPQGGGALGAKEDGIELRGDLGGAGAGF